MQSAPAIFILERRSAHSSSDLKTLQVCVNIITLHCILIYVPWRLCRYWWMFSVYWNTTPNILWDFNTVLAHAHVHTQMYMHAQVLLYTELERKSTKETQDTTFPLGTYKVIIATHCKFEPFCGVLMLMRRFETNCFDSCGHQLSACNIIVVRVRFGRVLDVSHSFFRTRSLYTHVCGKIPQ